MRSELVEEQLEVKYGLPKDVVFCKKCVISNQRPNATNELKYSTATKKEATFIGEDRICDACKYDEMKKTQIDWAQREKQLKELCDRYRSKDGSYDCIVPGSGGKDSRYASHVLKYQYGMNPLTVTWHPTIYTEIGLKNMDTWLSQYDNVTVRPNQDVHRLLTRLAFVNLVHPFQPFIIGQRSVAPRLAQQLKIPLIFYGELPAEYGADMSDPNNLKPTLRSRYFAGEHNFDNLLMGGVSVRELIEKHEVDRRDIHQYMPLTRQELESFPLDYHYLGYYLRWDPQEIYYYAAEKTGFIPNPQRTEGTYSKYSSLDDKMDGMHYYTTYIKFGIGRATYDAAQEIRNGKITREEGVALVKKYDAEFPKRYFQDVLEYMDISEEKFWDVIDNGRSAHLWRKETDSWILRHQAS